MIYEWKLVKTVTVSYSTFTDFDLKEILNVYNEENETNYKLEDIEDLWVKRNNIHLVMNDEKVIEYEWVFPEWGDYKRPNEYLYNQY